jgi:hypothetical protein
VSSLAPHGTSALVAGAAPQSVLGDRCKYLFHLFLLGFSLPATTVRRVRAKSTG